MRSVLLAALLAGCSHATPPHRFGTTLDAGSDAGALYYIVQTPAHWQACETAVEQALHMPIAGTPAPGGGIYVPPSQSQTTTYAQPLTNGTAYAFPADAVTVPVVGPNAVTMGLSAPTAIDSTWVPVTDAGAVVDAGGVADVGVPDVGVPVVDAGGVGLESGSHATPF